MEKDKLQALCDTIKAVFDQNNKNISLFRDRLPNGYLEKIHAILPEEYFWPDDPKNLSRTIVKNKKAILNILNIQTTAKSGQATFNIGDLSEQSEHTEHSEQNHSEHTEQHEHSEYVTRLDVVQIVSRMLKKALSERPEIIQNIQNGLELPPRKKILGEKGRKKDQRSWVKISTSVNSRLNDLFEAECKDKRLSRSELLDAILWSHYGKPDLD